MGLQSTRKAEVLVAYFLVILALVGLAIVFLLPSLMRFRHAG